MSMFIVTIITSAQKTPVNMLHVEPHSQAEKTVAIIKDLLHRNGGHGSFRFLSGKDLTSDDIDDQIKATIRKTLKCFPIRQTI